MLYVTLALWLFGLLLMGHGVYRLLGSIGRPVWVHWVLLPGSLVSAMGYIFGSLITGGEIRRASLMGGSSSSSSKSKAPAPQEAAVTAEATPKLKVVGPIVASLIAIVVCLLAIVGVKALIGKGAVETYGADVIRDGKLLPKTLDQSLPKTWGGVWTELDTQLRLVRRQAETILKQKWSDWRIWLFFYLSLCLLVRLQPSGGKLRATLLAPPVLVGVAAAVAAMNKPFSGYLTGDLWLLMSFCWSLLLLSLAGALVLRGVVLLLAVIAGKSDAK
ncbi:MAG: hypothetical protein NTV86_10465 [Planctomycetota bacterium]|nr:hypothetical protein [Planctomycetota bacterium]